MNEPGHFSFRSAPVRLRLTPDDFRLLAANDAFPIDGKVELIDGEVYRLNSRIADVNGRRMLIHNQPHQGRYGRVKIIPFGQRVVSVTISDLVVDTDTLLF